MIGVPAPLELKIEPGVHPTGHLFGMTFNLDTIWVTVVAGGLVVILGFVARKQLTKETPDHVPTKVQLAWETVVREVTTQVEDNLGKVNPFVVPLAVALFFFILIANWIEVIPTELNHETHLLPSPTADTNLTYAMAIMVMIGVWTFGIQQRGFRGYFGHFLAGKIAKNPLIDIPSRAFFTFLNVIEELIKPVTLALRLFGNIFAGGIMLALIAGLVSIAPFHIPLGSALTIFFSIIWKLFDTMFLGGLQAFIFALLTVLYFGMAGAHGEEHGEEHGDAEEHPHHPESAAV